MNAFAEGYEVALKLMGKDTDADENFEREIEEAVDEFLYEEYGIEDSYKFEKLLRDLAAMADRAKSDLSNKVYRGFAIEKDGYGMWLFKVEDE